MHFSEQWLEQRYGFADAFQLGFPHIPFGLLTDKN